MAEEANKDILEEEQKTEETTKEQAKESAPLSPEEQLKSDYNELNDKFLRLAAEYDNYRKRTQKEKEAIYPEAVISTVQKILPVLDNFGRAMSTPCSDSEFKKGLDMIAQSFADMLSRMAVEEFGEVGEDFDPNIHNAIMQVEHESLETNKIAEVFQKGYKIGDRIIRHAMVKVVN